MHPAGCGCCRSRGDFLRRGVDLDLPIMLAGSTDRIAGHYMIDDIGAAFGNAPIQAERAIGVEGLAFEAKVMCRNLCQVAAERVAGNGDVKRFAILTEFLCIDQRMLGQLNRFGGLIVVARCHHAAIGVDTILLELTLSLSAPMGDDDLVGVDTLINNALIARWAVYILETLVNNSGNIDWTTIYACFSRFFIHIVSESCILLARKAHGITFSVAKVTLKMSLRALSLNWSTLDLPLSGKLSTSSFG